MKPAATSSRTRSPRVRCCSTYVSWPSLVVFHVRPAVEVRMHRHQSGLTRSSRRSTASGGSPRTPTEAARAQHPCHLRIRAAGPHGTGRAERGEHQVEATVAERERERVGLHQRRRHAAAALPAAACRSIPADGPSPPRTRPGWSASVPGGAAAAQFQYPGAAHVAQQPYSASRSPSGHHRRSTSPKNSPCSAWYASASLSHQRRLACRACALVTGWRPTRTCPMPPRKWLPARQGQRPAGRADQGLKILRRACTVWSCAR